MHNFWQDIRYALRMLRKTPGFTAVAVITLALGIGANAVIFSVVNAVMLRPLPVAQPDRLMMVFHSYPKLNLPTASVMPYALGYYKEHLQSFSSLAAVTMARGPQNLTVAGEPQRVNTVLVSADFFPTLGVSPKLGRTFLAEEDAPGKGREAVLSYGLWKQQFGSDPQIVGKTLALDGVSYSIIGVMPEGFQMPSGAGLWIPLAFTPEEAKSTVEYLNVIARLKPGVGAQQAQAELDQTSAQLLRQFPELAPSGFHVIALPLAEVMQGNLRPALLVLLAAVGCVLLIACANVANLLLARA
jgi:predicted permease